jgi:hypothetical protein
MRAQLLDNQDPIDLTTATAVRIIVTTLDKTNELLDRAVTIDAGTDGWVELEWQAGDTATVGRYLVEFEVMWPSNKPQTFPNTGYNWLVIADDLG